MKVTPRSLCIPASADSSDTTGTPGRIFARPRRMTLSDSLSAAVTGDWSDFVCRVTVSGEIAAICAQALATSVVRSSKSCSTCNGDMSDCAIKRASFATLAVLGGYAGAVYHPIIRP